MIKKQWKKPLLSIDYRNIEEILEEKFLYEISKDIFIESSAYKYSLLKVIKELWWEKFFFKNSIL